MDDHKTPVEQNVFDVTTIESRVDQVQLERDLNAMVDTMGRVVTSNDFDRIKAFTTLLNSFNYAVQVQAKRTQWLPSDFRQFAIALDAMDRIGTEQPDDYGR